MLVIISRQVGAYDAEVSVVAVQCKRIHDDGKTKFLDIRGWINVGETLRRASVEGSITKATRGTRNRANKGVQVSAVSQVGCCTMCMTFLLGSEIPIIPSSKKDAFFAQTNPQQKMAVLECHA